MSEDLDVAVEESAAEDKVSIWRQVSKTDPKYTTKVSQRGGFTAIDAYSRFYEATKLWGPWGTGWGWDTYRDEPIDGVWVVTVALWYIGPDGQRKSGGQVTSAAQWTGKRTDLDAPKKARTDAVTKSLSFLGFNADVFLGRFDDHRYVEQRRREVEEDGRSRCENERSERSRYQDDARTMEEDVERMERGEPRTSVGPQGRPVPPLGDGIAADLPDAYAFPCYSCGTVLEPVVLRDSGMVAPAERKDDGGLVLHFDKCDVTQAGLAIHLGEFLELTPDHLTEVLLYAGVPAPVWQDGTVVPCEKKVLDKALRVLLTMGRSRVPETVSLERARGLGGERRVFDVAPLEDLLVDVLDVVAGRKPEASDGFTEEERAICAGWLQENGLESLAMLKDVTYLELAGLRRALARQEKAQREQRTRESF